jgi:hypothetical protein
MNRQRVASGRMAPPNSPGYSRTPLVEKLGIKAGTSLFIVNAPKGYLHLLEPLPANVTFSKRLSPAVNIAHLFTPNTDELIKYLDSFRDVLDPAAVIWVSWPKKASKVATDITDETIRRIALPLGLVDIKVCAVTDVWSGLKLVVRKELR